MNKEEMIFNFKDLRYIFNSIKMDYNPLDNRIIELFEKQISGLSNEDILKYVQFLESQDYSFYWGDNVSRFKEILKLTKGRYKNLSIDQPDDKCSHGLPKELDTDEARELFQRAIDVGFVEHNGGLYEWKGSRPQLAFFAELASEKLGTLKYKPYEIVFNKKNLAQEAQKTRDMKGMVANQNKIEDMFK